MSIVIVDSGGANLTSIKNAFEKISSQAVVSIDEDIICDIHITTRQSLET